MPRKRIKIFHNPSWLEIGGSGNMTLVLIHEMYEAYQAPWPQCKINSGGDGVCLCVCIGMWCETNASVTFFQVR